MSVRANIFYFVQWPIGSLADADLKRMLQVAFFPCIWHSNTKWYYAMLHESWCVCLHKTRILQALPTSWLTTMLQQYPGHA